MVLFLTNRLVLRGNRWCKRTVLEREGDGVVEYEGRGIEETGDSTRIVT